MKLTSTKSICPICLKRISANYVSNEEGQVLLEKECIEHGFFSTLVCEDIEFYKNWTMPLANNQAINPKSSSKKGCPYDCGICEEHKQQTCCVLLEVTKSCNMRCPICFANTEGSIEEDPSILQISKWYDMLMDKGGPFNIQLSGGEPTMRDDLSKVIKLGKKKGFTFFQINTNGIRIGTDKEYLKGLKEAGLNTVFLQFDGLDSETQVALRGKNNLEIKKKAIENCKEESIGVVLVPVIKKGLNDKRIGNIIRFAFENMPTVRGVHFQPLSFFGRYNASPINQNRMTLYNTLKELEIQTSGELDINFFSPGGAEHPSCSFSGDFTLSPNGKIVPLNTKKESCCCSSAQARDVVSRKWTISNISEDSLKSSGLSLSSLDLFLDQARNKTLSISCMVFQDAWNLDLERLKRCYIHEVSSDVELIPFCSYNLTNTAGKSLYRK